ncbi:MAG TPA: hypothetical protein PLS50_05290 [Candidatus Dojkabacteria bacterium]|nr:hypothetical protein [Ferruginibacter sp.]HRP37197.1 hypothetical protein [Candidatus Dojkabacteria bacterium]
MVLDLLEISYNYNSLNKINSEVIEINREKKEQGPHMYILFKNKPEFASFAKKLAKRDKTIKLIECSGSLWLCVPFDDDLADKPSDKPFEALMNIYWDK